MKALLLILALSMAGCSSLGALSEVTQKLDLEKFYQRDMVITVNGVTEEGTMVVPMSEKYDFMVEARGDLDMFIMNTCHKEEKKEKAWNVTKTVKSGLFGWGKKSIDVKNQASFVYYPNKLLESDGLCAMELRGLEKNPGRHSWAFIDFESPKYTMKATVLCNGREFSANGVSVCQSRVGLKQMVVFTEEVHPATNTCGFVGDATQYEIGLVKGPCLALFIGKTSKKRFKITTIGYEDILVRGE